MPAGAGAAGAAAGAAAPPVVAAAGGAASGAAGGVADSVTAGCSVVASFFWQAEKLNRSPNTTTTNKTHKEPFFIVIISYPFYFLPILFSRWCYLMQHESPCCRHEYPSDPCVCHTLQIVFSAGVLAVFRYYRVFLCHVNSNEHKGICIWCMHRHRCSCTCSQCMYR